MKLNFFLFLSFSEWSLSQKLEIFDISLFPSRADCVVWTEKYIFQQLTLWATSETLFWFDSQREMRLNCEIGWCWTRIDRRLLRVLFDRIKIHLHFALYNPLKGQWPQLDQIPYNINLSSKFSHSEAFCVVDVINSQWNSHKINQNRTLLLNKLFFSSTRRIFQCAGVVYYRLENDYWRKIAKIF